MSKVNSRQVQEAIEDVERTVASQVETLELARALGPASEGHPDPAAWPGRASEEVDRQYELGVYAYRFEYQGDGSVVVVSQIAGEETRVFVVENGSQLRSFHPLKRGDDN